MTLNPDQFTKIPAYVEYPTSADLGDDESFVYLHELHTAQYLETRGKTHAFRIHDGRTAWVDDKHYQPQNRNLVERYENEPLWVSSKWEHEEIINKLADEFNKNDSKPDDELNN